MTTTLNLNQMCVHRREHMGNGYCAIDFRTCTAPILEDCPIRESAHTLEHYLHIRHKSIYVPCLEAIAPPTENFLDAFRKESNECPMTLDDYQERGRE